MIPQKQKYHEALTFLESLECFGMKLDLENIQVLLSVLGDPHQDLKVIHVAGTNGKGSTSAMLASILQESGYSIGLYTSPHLCTPRERIQKNGMCISEERFIDLVHLVMSQVHLLRTSNNLFPTYFEVMTAIALRYFSDEKADFVVLETGMGGRLDSTNIVPSQIQVITNIDLEHTRYLGKTIREIAFEKAGIIKPCSFVITGAQGEALTVIEERCYEKGAHFFRLGKEIHFQLLQKNWEGERLIIQVGERKREIEIKLLGAHQLENAALAMGAVEALIQFGFFLPERAILSGFKKASWPGRFEILKKEPLVIIDAAHNPAGMRSLVNTWQEVVGPRGADLIFSSLEDKDVEKMVKNLCPIVEEVTLVEVSNPRTRKLKDLERVWRSYLPEEKIHLSTLQKVIQKLKNREKNTRPLLVTGSIYLLGEVLSPLSLLTDKRDHPPTIPEAPG
ncbi:MAG: bifunctional folylpolyglutamate synthase/dihydrofolate synthase [Chlamydiae bacterium]|nr:bifunctional folylpolyglutamate synthase/dihydrofolate synthase [Chlamydiota bacterium]MBI3277200.1 bifunctional folylpolyglutamate synthase/dihydrofolate synthase [Chlamydiota bacterium]